MSKRRLSDSKPSPQPDVRPHYRRYESAYFIFFFWPCWLSNGPEQKKEDMRLAKEREAEKAARSYDSLFSGEVDDDQQAEGSTRKTVRELEEDFM